MPNKIHRRIEVATTQFAVEANEKLLHVYMKTLSI